MWSVIGQERAVALLQRGLADGKLSHAYLFVGPEHVGKMTLALDLAQALNCGAAAPPCRECPACLRIAERRHADVQAIGLMKKEAEGEAKLIGIEQIRDVLHAANLPPFEGRHKVFIIASAELLSLDAANLLLKTLEEPVDNVTFILLTVNDKLLPLTVISRCQRVELAPLPPDREAAALVDRLHIEPERARLLAGLSHGCPEWALAAANDDSLLRQRDEELDRVLAVIGAGYEERFAYVARLAARFSDDRNAVYRVLGLWRDYWRDLMLLKLGCAGIITSTDRRDELAGLAGSYRLEQIKGAIDSIETAARQLRQNANPRLALEVLMLDIPVKEVGNAPLSAGR